ncbi:MAG: hypothetical protein OXH00_16905 [Candidatus Poribacteria bacterium]|nr:hypothetical protein [Candidatus Poribacteria bacterium]
MHTQATRWTQFITPLGGIVAFACFFLPWVESGAPFIFIMSGVDYFLFDDLILHVFPIAVAFITSAVIISLSLYMVIRRTPWKSKVPIRICAGIGLSHLLTVYLGHVRISQVPDINNYSTQLGFWGTVIGFVVAIMGVCLIRKKDVNGAAEVSVEARHPWSIIHAGGMLALVCVLMPWGGIGDPTGRSGFIVVYSHPLIMFVFVASTVTVGISFYALARDPHWRLRAPVFVSVGIGLGILLSYCVSSYIQENQMRNFLEGTRSEAAKYYSIKFGFWGTVIGYVIAAVGVFLTRRKNRDMRVEVPTASG